MTLCLARMEAPMTTARMMDATPSAHHWEELQFRVIYAICVPISFAATAANRLARRRDRHGAPQRSIFAEAIEAAGTTARMAFAG